MPSASKKVKERVSSRTKAGAGMTLEEAIHQLHSKSVVDLWPTVAVLLDLSRDGVYLAAGNGEIEVLKIGRLKKAPTAPLRKMLGMEAA
jgi:hypothetical protein